MKIAFITSLDPTDRRSWSGTLYYMMESLRRHCGEVTPIGPIETRLGLALNAMRKLKTMVGAPPSARSRSMWLSRDYARQIERRLDALDCDVAVAPAASAEIACLRTKIPIVYLSDATFRLMADYYPEFRTLSERAHRNGDRQEEMALRNAAASVFSSEWAAESAIRDYGVDAKDVHVIPFGANLDEIPDAPNLNSNPGSEVCSLLWLGADWERKGGDLALATLDSLRAQGVRATLTICGCAPPGHEAREDVQIVPFQDKNSAAGLARVAALYRAADLFFLPTRRECTAIVFSEACAFGVPIISTDTGGVSSIVRENVNGFLLPLEAGPDEYAKLIVDLHRDPARLRFLSQSARREFEERLNWDCWASRMKEVLVEVA